MTFDVKVPKSGKYQLKLLYVANPNRSTKTHVDVVVDGRKDELVINQRTSDKTGKSLGTYRVEEVVTVTVSNRDTDGFVVVDGLQLLSKP